jgi:uncharacterized membrane protein
MSNSHIMDPRPRIATSWLPESTAEWIFEVISVTALAFAIFCVMDAWPHLPSVVPQHFSLTGKPDAWGSKSKLWILPLFGVITYVLLTVVSRVPHTHSFPVEVTPENAPRLYRQSQMMLVWLKMELCCCLSYVAWAQTQVALGLHRGLGWGFLPAALIPITLTAYYFVRRFRREEATA